MPFKIDDQTLKDLEIFGDQRSSKSTVFSLFNQTFSDGGSSYLKSLLLNPTNDYTEIRRRHELIEYLIEQKERPVLNRRQFEFIERFLTLGVAVLKANPIDRLYLQLSEWVRPSNDYYLIKSGCHQLMAVFREVKRCFDFEVMPQHIQVHFQNLFEVIKELDFYLLNNDRLTFTQIIQVDELVRKKFLNQVRKAVEELYLLDAYWSVSGVSAISGFVLPEFTAAEHSIISLKGVWHPLIKSAVASDLILDEQQNLCFITGPNMAGKSTFLKATGIATYLAHVGFPVPASTFELPVYDGLMTTINLSDNLDLGFSHYYAEVSRVKDAAVNVAEGKKLMVIFDELFRGTNVKDAMEGSEAIVRAFADISRCTFFMSTHIVEVAGAVKYKSSIQFCCFESQLDRQNLTYSYQLKKGVSSERLGMFIIQQEGILEILESAKN